MVKALLEFYSYIKNLFFFYCLFWWFRIVRFEHINYITYGPSYDGSGNFMPFNSNICGNAKAGNNKYRENDHSRISAYMSEVLFFFSHFDNAAGERFIYIFIASHLFRCRKGCRSYMKFMK